MNRIRRWFDWYEDELRAIGIFITCVTVLVIVLGIVLSYTTSKSLQYNCKLDSRPSMHTSLWIDTSPYAYDPEGFCSTLKQKMETGDVQN